MARTCATLVDPRLHVGCGSIYLGDGWLNVDIPAPTVFLAIERPDLVDRFITPESDYYGRHADKTPDTLREGPVTRETVCDFYGRFDCLPARNGTVSQILSVQVFEHLDRQEAHAALQECRRVLRNDGVLRLDIPDADATLRLYRETGDEFYARHLFGPRRSEYGFHRHYNRAMLRSLCEEHGFRYLADDPNIHDFYPAIAMRFGKVA